MKALVVYESFFGNTEQVAKAIAKSLENRFEVEVLKAKQIIVEKLSGLDLLIVGTPTRKFSPSPDTKKLLKRIPKGSLKEIKVAAFDTRISLDDIKSSFLKKMINLFGYAAEPVSKQLCKKGGELAIQPEGFFVKDSEGPLKEGELKRAAEWLDNVK